MSGQQTKWFFVALIVLMLKFESKISFAEVSTSATEIDHNCQDVVLNRQMSFKFFNLLLKKVRNDIMDAIKLLTATYSFKEISRSIKLFIKNFFPQISLQKKSFLASK